MKLLGLSTAENECSLALVEDGLLVCEELWTAKLTHSRRLLGMIGHMLEKRAGITIDAVDGFVAAKGPGSFTGLRIGISVAKALAFAGQKPAAGISSLDGIGFRFAWSSIPVCAMMDARRGEVYCAVYRFEKGSLAWKSREQVLTPEKALENLHGYGPVLFAGSGARVYSAVIEDRFPDRVIAHDFMHYVSASAMLSCVTGEDDFFARPENMLYPNYIRKSDAQLKFEKKQVC
jgi:tRNA threonylcarbamoyladenosine biosynthesis protein TsaB